ncbi:MAG TPA: YbgC/FadM family acyl-CoA thioesterase [Rhodoferax sp.]|nr:YbgC/FadM family acyl-CoA thioesterase [Rhodoferax sp.]
MNPKRADFRCLHRLRVRWAEVDMQKIVFNAHYLMYFDTAMADYWRELAVPYEAAMHLLNGDLYVKKASVEYFSSARYDDQLEIGLRCGRIGNSSIIFDGAIFRGDTLLVTGELIYVFADPATQTSRPVPDALRDLLMAYESGQSMVRVETGNWATLESQASPLRQAVFVQEQGIDTTLVWDAADADAVHAILINRLGMAVASGRLVQQAPGVGRIGRMAVDRVLRGSSLGRAMLDALVSSARSRGDKEVMLHAQRSAEGFYRRLGFVARGAPFEEAGLDHIEMVLAL